MSDVIELESSPEPHIEQMRTRSSSRFATPHVTTTIKGKGKQKEPKTAMATGASKSRRPVIILTDSEEGDEIIVSPVRRLRTNPLSETTGPSSQPSRIRRLQPQPGGGGSESSVQNIPSSSKAHKSTRPLPLFLPSDEENEPPSLPSPPPSRRQTTTLVPNPVFHKVAATPAMITPVAPPTPPPSAAPESISVDEVDSEGDSDPTSRYVAQVLEIIPDVQPDHLLGLIMEHLPTAQDGVVQQVLHVLFENMNYPKADKKGKRKRVDADLEESASVKKAKLLVDYTSSEREFKGGNDYVELALNELQSDFPFVPKTYIRKVLATKRFYVPAHLAIAEQESNYNKSITNGQGQDLLYVHKSTAYRPPRSNGKERARADEEFEAERQWLRAQANLTTSTPASAAVSNGANEEPTEDGIECGCCFTDYPFDQMIQCPEAHLFCKTCMTAYASGLLGEHNHRIKCMHQSGCTLLFPVSELQRFLDPKLLELYERVKQRKEIEAAGLEGLEECPFCEWKCVIENEEEKLFRCGNEEDCGVVSCRGCKKLDHLPKSCKEMEEDKKLDGRHVIEEAMTRALMRNCPKCEKPFIKELGCNKMTCPNCHTLSCYICRQVVTGYEHFNQQPQANPGAQPQASSSKSKKCALWDPVEQRHADEVKAAAEKALREYKLAHPDMDEKDLAVELPKAPPPPAAGANPFALGGVAGIPPHYYHPMAGIPHGVRPAAARGLGAAGAGFGVGAGAGGAAFFGAGAFGGLVPGMQIPPPPAPVPRAHHVPARQGMRPPRDAMKRAAKVHRKR